MLCVGSVVGHHAVATDPGVAADWGSAGIAVNRGHQREGESGRNGERHLGLRRRSG